MKVLVLNCGSSSLKFDCFETSEKKHGIMSLVRVAQGYMECLGPNCIFTGRLGQNPPTQQKAATRNYRDAVLFAIRWLEQQIPDFRTEIRAVGHRVVHGGDTFLSPTRITPKVITRIQELSELAPLHNPPALEGIVASREIFPKSMPMVAIFDTSFHQTIPAHASTYAIPTELSRRYNIRKFGFHGIAHQSMLNGYATWVGKPVEKCSVITVQLGNGCSITAIQNGKSMDTSMGFTPLEGLVMGTRSGDLDPGLVSFLARKENAGWERIESVLNRESGLLGLSGLASDMRSILGQATGNSRAALAVQVFCYRVRKYIGAYMAVLGRTDALIFGGGIGENAPEIRNKICDGLKALGIELDAKKNLRPEPGKERISTRKSPVGCFLIPVDEAQLIATQTIDCVSLWYRNI